MPSRTIASNWSLCRIVIALTSALSVVACTLPTVASSLPSHVTAVAPDYVVVWNHPVGALDLHSTRSGAFVRRLSYGQALFSEMAYDTGTSSFWGVGADLQSEKTFVWEWKPGMVEVRRHPLLTKGLLALTQSGERRLVTYLNNSNEPTVAEIGRDLAIQNIATVPSFRSESAACTFSGADTPEPYSSSYWLDRSDMTVVRECPPEDSPACAFKHWREVRLRGGWLFCASDCLTCHEWTGKLWIRRSPIRTDLVDRLYSLKADPYDENVVYAVGVQDSPTEEGILRLLVSKDRGDSWRSVDIGRVLAGSLLGSLFFTADALWIPIDDDELKTLQLLEIKRGDKHELRNVVLPLNVSTAIPRRP
jgi:hypothetical protein